MQSTSNKDNLSQYEKELSNIIMKLDIKGEIKDKKHDLVNFINTKGKKLKKSRIKYSYTNAQTVWTECKIGEDEIYLFRITKRLDNKIRDMIREEYRIHNENEDFNNICPEFVCFYFSNFLNFSVFIIKDYYTLDEILDSEKLPNFYNEKSFIEFSKGELLLSSLETIKGLHLGEKYFICPFLTPYNLLYTDKSGKEYFFLSEIFLETDSVEKEIEIELINKDLNDWLVPGFQKNKFKLTYDSNIYCLGKIFSKIVSDKNKAYRELIINCINPNKTERWSIEKIEEYINDNNFEEKENEDNINNSINFSNIQTLNNEKDVDKSLVRDIEDFIENRFFENKSEESNKTKKSKTDNNNEKILEKSEKNPEEKKDNSEIKSLEIINDNEKNNINTNNEINETDETTKKNILLGQSKILDNNKIKNKDNNINNDGKGIINKELIGNNTKENELNIKNIQNNQNNFLKNNEYDKDINIINQGNDNIILNNNALENNNNLLIKENKDNNLSISKEENIKIQDKNEFFKESIEPNFDKITKCDKKKSELEKNNDLDKEKKTKGERLIQKIDNIDNDKQTDKKVGDKEKIQKRIENDDKENKMEKINQNNFNGEIKAIQLKDKGEKVNLEIDIKKENEVVINPIDINSQMKKKECNIKIDIKDKNGENNEFIGMNPKKEEEIKEINEEKNSSTKENESKNFNEIFIDKGLQKESQDEAKNIDNIIKNNNKDELSQNIENKDIKETKTLDSLDTENKIRETNIGIKIMDKIDGNNIQKNQDEPNFKNQQNKEKLNIENINENEIINEKKKDEINPKENISEKDLENNEEYKKLR